jgi:uncharacterized membrane protein
MSMRAFAVSMLALFLPAMTLSFPALATFKYCNNFKYDLHVAIAYETKDGFTSEGWAGVKPNSCYEDKEVNGPITFYYHAETDAIPGADGKSTTWLWGNRRAFSVLNKPFKITHAEFKAEGGRFAEFSGPYTLGVANGLATITFGDGSSGVSLSVQ